MPHSAPSAQQLVLSSRRDPRPLMPPAPAGILPQHWAELQTSGIAADVAALNVASFGRDSGLHWEDQRSQLLAHARLQIQTGSIAGNGHPQGQPGHLSGKLLNLEQRYRHLQSGGWRTLSDTLPGLPAFDQWKPSRPRPNRDKPGRSIRYESPPQFPDGGGLLLPRIPERCWRLICGRYGLPFPDEGAVAGGFWPWVLATRRLPLVVCEGWKKALALVSHGWAAVALPGVSMGIRRDAETGKRRLIAALQQLATAGRSFTIAFDAEARQSTARKVAAAAGALAQTFRTAGGRPAIAGLPLLPGATKTGLDDLLVARGPEALAAALADVGPRPVLPWRRPGDRVVPPGQRIGEAGDLPSPEDAPLVAIRGPMGCGKTTAIRSHVAGPQKHGVPVLLLAHRHSIGEATAAAIGVPWCPPRGSDQRQQGMGSCVDSWHPGSGLRITGSSWPGSVLVTEEVEQLIEHTLSSTATAVASHRPAVLRNIEETMRSAAQVVACDAQLSETTLQLMEKIKGCSASLIGSQHQPMAGRHFYCPEGFKTPDAAAKAFHSQLATARAAGMKGFCWSTAQQAGSRNAPQTLAAWHRQRWPEDKVLVVDSTTPDAAAALARDPNGEAAKWDWIYSSPTISSGISFDRWKPDIVLVYAGGAIGPEHAVQAAARVRSPEVPVWIFAPERSPGDALRMGSGATDTAQLIEDMRRAADPLLGQLEGVGEHWLEAWAEIGAKRNRQRFAYRATIAGLLEQEGWALQHSTSGVCPETTAALQLIAEAAIAAEDAAVRDAAVLTAAEATELERRRNLEPAERAALQRHRLAKRWGLKGAAPSQQLVEADRENARGRLRNGLILSSADALAMIPAHDWRKVLELDPGGQPFAPDRLRVTLAPRIAAFQALGVPQLLERFAAGETIAATDPALVGLHATATAYSRQLTAATGLSPGAKPTGTLRSVLRAVGWELQCAGRIKTRGEDRDALTYRATPEPLPEGVDREKLEAVLMAELRGNAAGAASSPIEKPYRGENCPAPPPGHYPPELQRWPLAPAVAVPWCSAPARCHRGRPRGFGSPAGTADPPQG